jgi:hypothetical protein
VLKQLYKRNHYFNYLENKRFKTIDYEI